MTVTRAAHRPTVLDGGFAASLALASVAVAGFPAVVRELAAPDTAGAAAFVVGILGALGLAVCFIAAGLRRGAIVAALPLFAGGVLLWFVQAFATEAVGWRIAIGVFGVLAAGLTTTGWLVVRRYAGRAYAGLALLIVGTAIVLLAPTYAVVIVGGLVTSVLPSIAANLLQLTARQA